MPKPLPMPSQAVLRRLLLYDPLTGTLSWLPRGIPTWDARYAGKPVGRTPAHNGYLQIGIGYAKLRQHRICWKWYYGTDPVDIDHINGDRTDNRIANLRSVTRSQNLRNRDPRHASQSGVHGVRWDKSRNKWIAQATINGRKTSLGRFDTVEEARDALIAATSGEGYTSRHHELIK